MNKFYRRLALALIDRRLRKMVRKAAKALTEANHKDQRTTTLHDVLEDHQEFIRLRHLRENIKHINNPWQGIFNPYWTVWPKSQKHVEPFEPHPVVKTELPPLSEADQEWADLNINEFFERLNAEVHSNADSLVIVSLEEREQEQKEFLEKYQQYMRKVYEENRKKLEN